MKKYLFLFFSLLTITGGMSAQTDVTDRIINPDFESGDLTGWTISVSPAGSGASYQEVSAQNRGGEGGNHGVNAFCAWGQLTNYGDYELSQTITGLENGLYRVQCLLSGIVRVWHTIEGEVNAFPTLTTQRLFAGNATDGYKYQFWGSADRYSAENLAIIGTPETYSFADHVESLPDTPDAFREMLVDVPVTNGTLTIGVRTEGNRNTQGLVFPTKTHPDGGGFNADHFRLTKLPEPVRLHVYTVSDPCERVYSLEDDPALELNFTETDLQITSINGLETIPLTDLIYFTLKNKEENGPTPVDAIAGPAAFSVGPNPVSNILTVTGSQAIANVALFDLQGRCVLQLAPVGDRTVNLSTATLPSGAYLLRITDQTAHVIIKKIIRN
ncbi:MAG: T9SS type A sorting domain-containing protein [Dysgonamonadaceae bacterium]|jgi:hypothetical protein|nr:T9SS type A sorting domain-containing protein [Dysgonamonadaceae bacterium]